MNYIWKNHCNTDENDAKKTFRGGTDNAKLVMQMIHENAVTKISWHLESLSTNTIGTYNT